MKNIDLFERLKSQKDRPFNVIKKINHNRLRSIFLTNQKDRFPKDKSDQKYRLIEELKRSIRSIFWSNQKDQL